MYFSSYRIGYRVGYRVSYQASYRIVSLNDPIPGRPIRIAQVCFFPYNALLSSAFRLEATYNDFKHKIRLGKTSPSKRRHLAAQKGLWINQ